jgi:hypothetical protein
MHTDGEASGTGIDIVARQRTLRLCIEAPIQVERQRMRGNDGAAAQGLEHGLRQIRV